MKARRLKATNTQRFLFEAWNYKYSEDIEDSWAEKSKNFDFMTRSIINR